MTSISREISRAAQKFREKGIETARLDAELLMAHALKLSREKLLLKDDQPLSIQEMETFHGFVNRRLTREPVARITGKKEFWSLDFHLNENTLVPRPDSETLVEAVLKNVKEMKLEAPAILDLGTGSGCLLLALLSELEEATGLGTDVSEKALECARMNAEALGLSERTKFRRYDWNDPVPADFGYFRVVVSNPPYIREKDIENLAPEVKNFAPKKALNGGPDGLRDLKKITAQAPEFFSRRPALLALEVGENQADNVEKYFKNNNFRSIEVFRDLAGLPRAVTGIFQNS